jgi:HSP20 family molecular chaperone IbpA
MSTELTTQEREREQTDGAAVERTCGSKTYSPRIDIWEAPDELVLYADMPGVPAGNVDIQFENRELTIHGKVPPRHENVEFLYGEYGVGDYYRTFAIGETVDAARISAEMQHGVLTLRLPKTEAVRPRRIEVRSSP